MFLEIATGENALGAGEIALVVALGEPALDENAGDEETTGFTARGGESDRFATLSCVGKVAEKREGLNARHEACSSYMPTPGVSSLAYQSPTLRVALPKVAE